MNDEEKINYPEEPSDTDLLDIEEDDGKPIADDDELEPEDDADDIDEDSFDEEE